MPPMVPPSIGTTVVFVLVVATVAAAFVAGVARAAGRAVALRVGVGVAVWLGVSALISESGVLEADTLPPPAIFFFAASMAIPLVVGLSPLGRSLSTGVPIAALVGVQGFRLPLELVLHQWYLDGVLPIQMTYSGHNFDIVTGILALAVGAWLWRGQSSGALRRRVVLAFNVVGLALLVTVATIAVVSAPLPIRQYLNDPPVLLVFHAPYGWIVPFCVGGALLGHVLVFRWLASGADRSASP